MDTRYKIVLWIAVVLLFFKMGTAQEKISKTIEKTLPLTNVGELRLENKYGDINVNGWNRNEVSISIKITVNHRKKENAKDLLGRINTKIKSSSGFASIVSEISNKNTGWLADLFNKANPIDFDRSRVQIDYQVYLPSKAKLKVTNRFGDVVIEDWSGPLNLLLEHGDLWVSDNLGKADITMKYGKLRARNINYASIYLKNGELDMIDSKSLRLNTDGSNMRLNAVSSLEIYSNKDDIFLEEVGTVYGSLKFSKLEAQRLIRNVDLNLKITDFRIAEILESAAEIVLEQESSDINLNVAGFSHRFSATLEQGVVRLPKSFENVNSNMLDKSSKLREIEATYGNGKEGSITITGIKGIVTLRE